MSFTAFYKRNLGFYKLAIASNLEYRLNFLVTALISLGGLAGSLFGLFLFYRPASNRVGVGFCGTTIFA